MSRTPPKKSTHLKKKLELVPLPMSQQRDKSDRKGVFNSFFTDDEFNRLRYHSCIYSLLNVQFFSRYPRPADDYRFRKPKGLITTPIPSTSPKNLRKRDARDEVALRRLETAIPAKRPKISPSNTSQPVCSGMLHSFYHAVFHLLYFSEAHSVAPPRTIGPILVPSKLPSKRIPKKQPSQKK